MENFKKKKTVSGTWCEIPSAYGANVIAKSGMDFIIIDMEHSVMTNETAQDMVMAAQCEGCAAFIRVPSIDESSILKALDTGADGIIVPHVESLSEAESIVAYAKFAPDGNRGYNPFIRAGNYGNVPKDFFAAQNKKTMIGVIIESLSGLENLGAIASCKHIDICYIGQYDISVALGCPGDVKNKKVTDAVRASAKIINKHGKMAGCMVQNPKDASDMKKAGIKFMVYGVDTALLGGACRRFCEELKGGGK